MVIGSIYEELTAIDYRKVYVTRQEETLMHCNRHPEPSNGKF